MKGEVMTDVPEPVCLVKSRQRVVDHGEVFTPEWMVEDMLGLVQEESERIDSRFLEPACGSGNFLVAVLARKLRTVEMRFGGSDFEKRHHALLSLMCVYGIELLEDNAVECRGNLLIVLSAYLGLTSGDDSHRAAQAVLAANIVQGDALTLTSGTGEPISFPEWGYLGRGRFQRRDFRYDNLTQMSSFGEDSLFAAMKPHEIFTPTKDYPAMTVQEIARG